MLRKCKTLLKVSSKWCIEHLLATLCPSHLKQLHSHFTTARSKPHITFSEKQCHCKWILFMLNYPLNKWKYNWVDWHNKVDSFNVRSSLYCCDLLFMSVLSAGKPKKCMSDPVCSLFWHPYAEQWKIMCFTKLNLQKTVDNVCFPVSDFFVHRPLLLSSMAT